MEYSVQISKTFCRWKGKAGRRLDVCLDALLSGYAVVLYVKLCFFFFFPKKKKKCTLPYSISLNLRYVFVGFI